MIFLRSFSFIDTKKYFTFASQTNKFRIASKENLLMNYPLLQQLTRYFLDFIWIAVCWAKISKLKWLSLSYNGSTLIYTVILSLALSFLTWVICDPGKHCLIGSIVAQTVIVVKLFNSKFRILSPKITS